MMAGVRLVEARRRNAHVEQAETDHRVRRNVEAAVPRVDEMDPWRPWAMAGDRQAERRPVLRQPPAPQLSGAGAVACGAAAGSTTFTLMRSETSPAANAEHGSCRRTRAAACVRRAGCSVCLVSVCSRLL